MADITIDAAVNADLNWRSDRLGPVWTSATVGYVFFINSARTEAQYRKTTDGGDTWGSAVSAITDGDSLLRVTLWFDKWTPGDSGTKIHIWVYRWSVDSWHYRSLDTSSDTLGSTIQASPGEPDAGAHESLTTHVQSCVKARNGYLYLAYQNSAGGGWRRSVDGGANWTSRTTPFESSARDPVLAIPATTSDNADAALIFWDASADELSVKMYDDSANTWTETSIATSMVESGDYLQMAASIRHSDGHVILSAWSALDSATADLRAWDLTLDSIASPTITAKTNVLTDTAEGAGVAIQVDQNTDDLYVAYLRGTAWGSDVHARYKISTDDGATWGSEQTLSVTNDNHVAIWTDLSSASTGGLFAPVWFNTDLDDLMLNADNAVALGAVSRTLAGTNGAPSGVLAATVGGIPQFVAAGTAAWTATNGATIAPGLPTGWAADDIHVLIAHRSDNTAMTSLAGSGWTNIAGLTGNNTAAQRVEVWWRRAVGGDSAPTVTFGSSTVVRGAQIIGIRGCPTSGDPFSTSSRSDNAASATITFATITPTDANTRLIAAYAYEDDPTAASTITNWSPFVITTSSLGNDAAIGFSLKQWPTASSATGALTSTASGGTFTNSPNVGILLSLKPLSTIVSRSVAGTNGEPSGTLSKQLAAFRTVAGTNGAPSGVLARTAAAFARAVAGTAGAPSGALVRVYQALRAVAGTNGAPSGSLGYSLGLITRAVAGTMGTPSATLARTYQAVRAVAGTAGAPSGLLSRTAGAFARAVAGANGTPSGTLDYAFGLITRSVAGVMGTPAATLARRYQALRTLTGSQEAATGVLNRTAGAFARAVVGAAGQPTATLARIKQAARTVVGSMPTATGILQSAFGVINRAVSGAMGAPSGAVSRRLAAFRTVEGSQPTPTGILARTAAAFARGLAGAMAAATGLLTRTHSSETTAVAGSATDAAYGAVVAADSLYVTAGATDTALVGAAATDSEG